MACFHLCWWTCGISHSLLLATPWASLHSTSGGAMMALKDDCERFEVLFPPGHIYSSKQGGLRRYYNPPWFNESIPAEPYDPLTLRHAFEKSVIKRLMTDVPFGVLLSGGLDSSLVAAVAQRYLAGSKAAKQWGNKLHSFCVGLEGSPDLKAAREVANYLGTVHKEFHFTVQAAHSTAPDCPSLPATHHTSGRQLCGNLPWQRGAAGRNYQGKPAGSSLFTSHFSIRVHHRPCSSATPRLHSACANHSALPPVWLRCLPLHDVACATLGAIIACKPVRPACRVVSP